MIGVKCILHTYKNGERSNDYLEVYSSGSNDEMVELVFADGKTTSRVEVNGTDLITAIQNCMHTNKGIEVDLSFMNK